MSQGGLSRETDGGIFDVKATVDRAIGIGTLCTGELPIAEAIEVVQGYAYWLAQWSGYRVQAVDYRRNFRVRA